MMKYPINVAVLRIMLFSVYVIEFGVYEEKDKRLRAMRTLHEILNKTYF